MASHPIIRSGSSSDENNQRRDESEGLDYLSFMPMEVLLHIFSFLPLQSWILMSLVSKRWNYFWTHIPTLELIEYTMVPRILRKDIWCSFCDQLHTYLSTDHACHERLRKAATNKFVSIVDRILLLHSGCTITRFRLMINYEGLQGYKSRIDRWVDFAMTTNIESLTLNFTGSRNHSTVLRSHGLYLDAIYRFMGPRTFAPEILKDFTLIGCLYNPDVFVAFKSLRRLALFNCNIYSGPIDEILSSCPLLEALDLIGCVFPENFMECKEELKIKEFILVKCMAYGSRSFVIDLVLPSLVTLKFVTQDLQSSRIKGVTRLKKTEVAIGSRFPDPNLDLGSIMDELLIDLSQCQRLEINSWSIQILPPRESLPSQLLLLKFQNLRNLILNIFMVIQELPGLAYLLSCCPKLETLHFDVNLAQLANFVHDGLIQNPVAFYGEESYWESYPLRFHFLESSLKKVSITGFSGRDMEIDILRFLLQNAMGLEELKIGQTSLSNQQKIEQRRIMINYSGLISSFTRASPNARITFLY